MATAVLDVDIEDLPGELTRLERYSRALVLVRLGRAPVGQVKLRVVNGRISGLELREALLPLVTTPFCDRWFRDFVGWSDESLPGFVPPLATIAVCTRDRPEDLERCLKGILCLPEDGQEIMVIDNCPSTEITRRIVERYARIRYVRETRPGASAARNRALREAKHEIVAFSDDDAAPDSGWLRALVRNFSDPLVLCVTGLTMPLELETKAQEAFERHCPFGRGFKRVIFDGTEHNPLQVGSVGTSANMALRKSIQTLVGFYDEALGPGTVTRSGEDFAMFSQILAAGYRIVYDPAALSWHRHRRTWPELRKAVYGHGTGVYGFLTRSLLVDHELTAPSSAWGWLRHGQIPALLRSLIRHPDREPLDLLLAELGGCLAGPWAYLSSRRRVARMTPKPK
jgi:cellulose synthase/poly-beta-1,6-N-acetylglucosamine synthase-like glycosyltransferase